jgi:hypothetical protein
VEGNSAREGRDGGRLIGKMEAVAAARQDASNLARGEQ